MPFLGFVLLFLELYLLITLGARIGFGPMFAEIVLTGVLGYWVMRRVGRTAFQPAQLIGVFLHAVGRGMAARKPIEWLLLGGLLLIIPGILTDILGLVLVAAFLGRLGRGGRERQPSSTSEPIDIEFDIRDDDATT